MAIIHIYGARVIFLLLYDNQDTESESQEIEIDISGPIFTHKNTKGSMGQWYPYSTILEQNIVAIIHIYGARAISPLFCDNQDTEYESCETEMSRSQPILNHKKIPKYLWNNDIHNIQYGRKNCGSSSYLRR